MSWMDDFDILPNSTSDYNDCNMSQTECEELQTINSPGPPINYYDENSFELQEENCLRLPTHYTNENPSGPLTSYTNEVNSFQLQAEKSPWLTTQYTNYSYLNLNNGRNSNGLHNDKAMITQSANAFPRNGRRFRKGKISLTVEQQQFKDDYYHIFTNKRKFRKEYVKIIDIDFISNELEFKITRNEIRSIDLYFKKRAVYKEKIINFLKKNKSKILEKYPQII